MISVLLASVLAGAPAPVADEVARRVERSEAARRAGHLDEALDVLEAHEPKGATPAGRLRLRLQRARVTYYRASLAGTSQDAVITDLRAIAAESEALDDAVLRADARDQLGLAIFARDSQSTDQAEARAFFVQALEERRAAGDTRAVAESLFHVGISWEDRKDPTPEDRAKALGLYEESLAAAEKDGFDVEASYALRHIARQKQDAGDLDGAIKGFERSLALREKAGYRIDIAPSLLALGDAWRDKGDSARARWYFERARLEADRIAAPRFRTMADEALVSLDAKTPNPQP